MREVGPQLLDPVGNLDSDSPPRLLTPALGLSHLYTKAWPNARGTMALYLAEGHGGSR